MPDFAYAPLAAKALELVESFGRDVTLRQLNVTPPDADLEWRGPADPRAVPLATETVRAVFVDPSSARSLGLDATVTDWVARSQQFAITAAVDDAESFGEILDGTETFRVLGISTLKPGPTVLLHFWGLAR